MTKRVIALGTFDGVHLGHRQILNKMLEFADVSGLEPLIYTFSNHPLAAFGKAPKLIMQDEERIRLLAGFAPVEAVPFNLEYAAIAPREFAVQLVKKYGAAAVVAGFNYTFGAKGAGNMQAMRELGIEMGFEVLEVPPFVQDGMPVSSSRIRACVEKGDIRGANAMLGRDFEICSTAAESGKNIRLNAAQWQILPADGIYRADCGESVQGTLAVKEETMMFSCNKNADKGSIIRLCLKHKII